MVEIWLNKRELVKINFYLYKANNYATIIYFSIRSWDGTYGKFVKCKFCKLILKISYLHKSKVNDINFQQGA